MPAEKLVDRIKVQYAPSETARLRKEAEARNVKLAAYIREASLTKQAVAGSRVKGSETLKLSAEMAMYTAHLRRIGNNINQLAKQANSGMVAVTHEEMLAALGDLRQMALAIRKLQDKCLR